jgi:hypothetical protein
MTTSLRGKTVRLSAPRESDFARDAACIFAVGGTEARARLPFWDDRVRNAPDTCCEVVTQDPGEIVVGQGGKESRVALRDAGELRGLFLGRDSAYLDISGLAHHVWAPIVREGLASLRRFWVLYAEPDRYRPHPSPASATLFDLSTSINGVSPLPGFANLRGPIDERKALFVPLLGFEGTRARQIAMSLDPVPRVVPVVGVPGFRIEYPFVTVVCNQELLEDYQAHASVKLARASCPFEAYDALREINREYADAYMYVAPIGTKPHALGAVWYCIDNMATTEIMYDHPVRKPQRTYGIGDVHVYCLKDG